MANVLSTLFHDIAVAIRKKTGAPDDDLMAPAEFPERIMDIDIDNGTYADVKWVAATGEFTPASTGEAVTVEHNLGVVPDFIMVWHPTLISSATASSYPDEFMALGFAYSSEIAEQTGIADRNQTNVLTSAKTGYIFSPSASKPLDGSDTADVAYNATATTFVAGAAADLHGGKRYLWLVIGHK